ncbi:MAG: PTS sugar transporter subunit IIA, partial [Planctomycetaceae bacterium]
MSKLVLTAPLSGWMTPLEEVPDAAFAGRMVGDGAAIDPTDSILRAPCDGIVTMVADARHALTIR